MKHPQPTGDDRKGPRAAPTRESRSAGARSMSTIPAARDASKLSLAASKHGTARNMNTVAKMAQLAAELENRTAGVSARAAG